MEGYRYSGQFPNGPPFRNLDEMLRWMHINDTKDRNQKTWMSILRQHGLTDLVKDKPHQFITIALPNTYPLEKILKYTEKPHSWARGSILSIEKYSKVGENLHIHILKEGYYTKTKIIRDLKRRFKVEGNFIDVRRGHEQADFEHRQSYIKGDKMDTEKMENVEKDKQWRTENNLRNYYLI